MENLHRLLWPCVAILAALASLGFAVRAIRWAKKGSKAASILAAAAFPFADQPPPNEQVEIANRLREDSESGSPE